MLASLRNFNKKPPILVGGLEVGRGFSLFRTVPDPFFHSFYWRHFARRRHWRQERNSRSLDCHPRRYPPRRVGCRLESARRCHGMTFCVPWSARWRRHRPWCIRQVRRRPCLCLGFCERVSRAPPSIDNNRTPIVDWWLSSPVAIVVYSCVFGITKIVQWTSVGGKTCVMQGSPFASSSSSFFSVLMMCVVPVFSFRTILSKYGFVKNLKLKLSAIFQCGIILYT